MTVAVPDSLYALPFAAISSGFLAALKPGCFESPVASNSWFLTHRSGFKILEESGHTSSLFLRLHP